MNFIQRFSLLPLEWAYRFGVLCRNLWYDYVYKGKKFPIKVISVGNVSVGGTGKTPMAEWLIAYSLQKNIPCAYLSRGYGRKTKGFILVKPKEHTAEQVGDEALQVASNFNVPVAVCENRVTGVQQLLQQFPSLKLVILDDAFQHRSIHRDLDIVLIDPAKPPHQDRLLPTGRLREPFRNIKRAHLAILSKANLFSDSELKKISSRIKIPKANAHLVSVDLIHCFDASKIPLDTINREPCYAVSAIGNSQSFIKQLFQTNLNVIAYKAFKDHYMIPEKEIQSIVKKCRRLVKDKVFNVVPIIVFTEKDFYRLKNQPYFAPTDIPMYYLKVKFEFSQVPKEIEAFFNDFR